MQPDADRLAVPAIRDHAADGLEVLPGVSEEFSAAHLGVEFPERLDALLQVVDHL